MIGYALLKVTFVVVGQSNSRWLHLSLQHYFTHPPSLEFASELRRSTFFFIGVFEDTGSDSIYETHGAELSTRGFLRKMVARDEANWEYDPWFLYLLVSN